MSQVKSRELGVIQNLLCHSRAGGNPANNRTLITQICADLFLRFGVVGENTNNGGVIDKYKKGSNIVRPFHVCIKYIIFAICFLLFVICIYFCVCFNWSAGAHKVPVTISIINSTDSRPELVFFHNRNRVSRFFA